MKKIALLLLLCQLARAQNINKMEYYIDTDPGVGAGINIPITASSTVNPNFTISINSLTDGIHLLNIRCRSQNNFWSLTDMKAFYKSSIISPSPLVNIVKMEYYVDNDPGTGSGVNVPITAGTTITDHVFSFPVTSLTDGIHLVSVRVKDANNVWSLVQTRAFYKQTISSIPTLPNIVKMEYYIDNDPGTGAGINVPITAATLLGNVGFSVNVNALTDGIHLLSVRVKNANNVWSIVTTNAFYKQTVSTPPALANILQMEYFIDNDPGYGAGNQIAVTAGVSIIFNFTASLASLALGTHKMSIRVKDSSNRW